MMVATVLRNGQVLMKEVLEGVAKNNCDLVVITSESARRHSEQSKSRNLRNLLKYIPGDLFFIDSDVVLREGVVEAMRKELETSDVVSVPTKKGSSSHSCIAVKRTLLGELEKVLDLKSCAFCEFCNQHAPKVLCDLGVYETKRQDLLV